MIDRKYNFNTQYINKLIKTNEFTTRKKICERLEITENALNLKISRRTLIYINEAIELSDELHMNVIDVFCPTEQMMFEVYYNDYNIEKYYNKKSYNDFNLNQKYLKQLLNDKGIHINELCNLWSLKIVSIYDKLRGDTKITVKEGILLSSYMELPVEKIFCPTNNELIHVISKEFNKSLKKSNESDKLIINKYLIEGFNMNNINVNKQYISNLLYMENKKSKDLSQILNLSLSHIYNKLNKKIDFEFDEVWKISAFLNLPIKKVFNPTSKDITDLTIKVTNAKKERQKQLAKNAADRRKKRKQKKSKQ
ncbi:MAG: hypothetical protein PVG30_02235 [Gammaproteobacteria bacterium]|jgi:hypothetical protein